LKNPDIFPGVITTPTSVGVSIEQKINFSTTTISRPTTEVSSSDMDTLFRESVIGETVNNIETKNYDTATSTKLIPKELGIARETTTFVAKEIKTIDDQIMTSQSSVEVGTNLLPIKFESSTERQLTYKLTPIPVIMTEPVFENHIGEQVTKETTATSLMFSSATGVDKSTSNHISRKGVRTTKDETPGQAFSDNFHGENKTGSKKKETDKFSNDIFSSSNVDPDNISEDQVIEISEVLATTILLQNISTEQKDNLTTAGHAQSSMSQVGSEIELAPTPTSPTQEESIIVSDPNDVNSTKFTYSDGDEEKPPTVSNSSSFADMTNSITASDVNNSTGSVNENVVNTEMLVTFMEDLVESPSLSVETPHESTDTTSNPSNNANYSKSPQNPADLSETFETSQSNPSKTKPVWRKPTRGPKRDKSPPINS